MDSGYHHQPYYTKAIIDTTFEKWRNLIMQEANASVNQTRLEKAVIKQKASMWKSHCKISKYYIWEHEGTALGLNSGCNALA